MIKTLYYNLTEPSALVVDEEQCRRARLLSSLLIPLMLVAAVGSGVSTIEIEKITVAMLFVVALLAYVFSCTQYFMIAGVVVTVAICREIINQHNGKIWCDENVRAGATFYFILPIKKNRE